MAWFVTGAWVLQAVAGGVLLRRRLGRGGPGRDVPRSLGAVVVGHVTLSVVALVLWLVFAGTGAAATGWTAFVLLTVGNGLGDTQLVRRSRNAVGAGSSWRSDYGTAIGGVFTGRFPRLVTFHALFAGVVYFGALAACLMA